MKKVPLVLFILLLALTATLHATTVERLGLDDLVRKAHRIVVGKVRTSRTYWTADRKLILTSYTVDVSESIKGQAGRTVELTTVGGRIGTTELHVSGMVSFAFTLPPGVASPARGASAKRRHPAGAGNR